MTEKPVSTLNSSNEDFKNLRPRCYDGSNIYGNGTLDGENRVSDVRESEPCKHPTGTDGSGDITKAFEAADDLPLRIAEVIERFRQATKLRLRPDSAEQYAAVFRRFAKGVNLESYSRKQLSSGPKGRTLIIDHLDKIPEPSRRYVVAALKPVWVNGLTLPWPVDSKRDLAPFPRVERRESPPDTDVKAWAKALANEKDAYLRLVWLFTGQHGWRPSHVCHIKWRNVQYDVKGKPVAIVASGTKEKFKTCSPVAVRLAPDVVEALQQWKKEAEEVEKVSPNEPILPWKSVTGRLERSREQMYGEYLVHWERLKKRWQLPDLCPSDLRHWVATTSRKAGLSIPATAYMMGHDASQGGVMRSWYDNPQLQDIFDEQAARLPNGPLGLLNSPAVEFEGGWSKEEASLMNAYHAKQLTPMEFVNALEKLEQQRSIQQAPIVER